MAGAGCLQNATTLLRLAHRPAAGGCDKQRSSGTATGTRSGLGNMADIVNLKERREAKIAEEKTAYLHALLCQAALASDIRCLSWDDRFLIANEVVAAALGSGWAITREP